MKLRPGLTKAINKWVGLACRGRTVVGQPTHDDEINIKGSIPGTDPVGEKMEKK